MVAKYLTQTERDILFKELSNVQQEYLTNFLKRGKKTAFASILAQQKGEGSEEDYKHISTNWRLVDYIDAGVVTETLKCECGRSLRYQYIVKNLKTNKILKFGKSHFEEHTNIPAEIVKQVIEGMTKIDYELDEILIKLRNNWSLENNEGIQLPLNIEIPRDIKEHLELKLPLLDKQVNKLLGILFEHTKHEINLQSVEFNNTEPNQISLFDEVMTLGIEQGFNTKPIYNKVLHNFLSESEKSFIKSFIQQHEIISTRQLCEFLIEHKGSNAKRYLSGKPLIYPYVANYLENLEYEGLVFFGENLDYRDKTFISICYNIQMV
ncbi:MULTISPECIES: DUF3895 domain-containing protein [Bacillus cereus group]|uniref:DUF3895 domain-containing protein n=1 Tax=Bacillus cereus group TaxID=86661 RepID=UPI001298AB96|nr:DUF3895 domain-containing protein [Bacillus cereus]MEC2468045.1 DUF3895 domain-containing protein [Bacillus cereus]MRC87533.1 DUF3895 domain-containing protein [Bacillus thuringiensis]HDR6957136.1 DUF3895 domain-containing protein [Bacillus cereus]HDR8408425.1 DUF3895 domain-containing protein [Bacillus cereus]